MEPKMLTPHRIRVLGKGKAIIRKKKNTHLHTYIILKEIIYKLLASQPGNCDNIKWVVHAV